MSVKVRFFAQFRELLGTDLLIAVQPGISFAALVQGIAGKSREGYAALFDAGGSFHEHIILMRNGKRIEIADAEKTMISDGDEIAVFPPVAGG